MKRFLIKFFLILFLSVVSFGAGIGIAELTLRRNDTAPVATVPVPEIQTNQPEEIAPVEEKTEESAPVEIETTPPPTEPIAEPITFSFAILGDAQYAKPGTYGGLQKAVREITKLNPDFIFSMGDQVSSCDNKNECKDKLLAWKALLGKYASKNYPMQGNHDRTGEEKADSAWQEAFNLPTNGPAGYSELAYSFDYKNSHFVVLDSEKPEERLINGEQRAWLEQDLRRNKQPNTFVFFHEPAYPVSSKITESLDEKPGERDALWGILTRYKVNAVFVGHEHIHSRRKISGIYQFGFGNTDSFNHDMSKPGVAEYAYQGQHFGIVEIKNTGITVKVYTVDGKLLNTFVLRKE